MRYLIIPVIFALSACSVANVTERNSGTGFSNTTTAAPATSTVPAGETDYRGKLFEEIGQN